MSVKAVGKYLPISARKGRQAVDIIRGKDAGEALLALKFLPNRSAKMVHNVLKSAVYNAQNNNDQNVEELYISEAFVDEGPTQKRFRPRAMGRASKIRKRTCHVTIIVDNKGEGR
ncbi:MAG: 50S ribosomal protein L22 [Candidatus Caldatribacteriota bacterium]|nr:50S ribosomal protein L22 [Candidatus Caldatribacteriota bacterium]